MRGYHPGSVDSQRTGREEAKLWASGVCQVASSIFLSLVLMAAIASTASGAGERVGRPPPETGLGWLAGPCLPSLGFGSNGWTNARPPPPIPSARWGHSMAYDTRSHR